MSPPRSTSYAQPRTDSRRAVRARTDAGTTLAVAPIAVLGTKERGGESSATARLLALRAARRVKRLYTDLSRASEGVRLVAELQERHARTLLDYGRAKGNAPATIKSDWSILRSWMADPCRFRMLRFPQSALACGCAAGLLVASGEAQASPSAPAAPFTTPAERCIVPAADYHRVNPYVLRAILKIESGLNPKAIGRNANGTVDLGMGQMNSIHFKELAKHGITPQHLLDACVGTYVAAWHLGRVMSQYGNTWEGVARYHSTTPYFNQRYQVLLVNELVRSGVIQGKVQRVPSLGRPPAPAPAGSRFRPPASPSLAFDDAGPFSPR